jgi:hypothetical protein
MSNTYSKKKTGTDRHEKKKKDQKESDYGWQFPLNSKDKYKVKKFK